MACLASKTHDPATYSQASAAALLAMTKLTSTALRNIFTAPANGNVLARMHGYVSGTSVEPRVLWGILDGTTVRMRMAPMGARLPSGPTFTMSQEVTGVITGLTPGNSYTFDGSYDVEIVDTAGAAGYGGANTAGASGPGGFEFEIWETLNLLGSCLYDPAVAVTEATTALLAMTVMDTTNLRITFTAPGSGNVYWRIYVPFHGSTTIGQVLLGILESSTVRARVAPIMGCPFGAIAATSCVGLEASGVITGLTPGNSYTWDAAYGVETISGAGGLKYGGPNDTTTNNAFGAAAFEVWAA